jgi:hypothetical protein
VLEIHGRVVQSVCTSLLRCSCTHFPSQLSQNHHEALLQDATQGRGLMKRKTCQTTDSTLLQEPARSQRSSRLRSSPSSKLDIMASLLGTAVISSARLESVARIENTVVDVYYRIDSMKSEDGQLDWSSKWGGIFGWLTRSLFCGGGKISKYLCLAKSGHGPMLRSSWRAAGRR